MRKVNSKIEDHAHVIDVDIASGNDESIVRNLNVASFFTKKSRAILDKNEDVTVCNMVNAIITLALLNAELLHVQIFYEPHCADLNIKVFNADTNYFGVYKPILNRCVHLDQPSNLLQLTTLEGDLIELVADAKDKLAGAV